MSFFIHQTSIVNANAKIGLGSKIWHWSHVMENVQIGKNCIIGQNCFIGRNVKIGNNVKIQNNISIYDGVEIEDDVFCGPNVVFTNVINPRSNFERKNEFKKTLIQKGATLGANSTIICGNEVGAYSFIAAAAVVTKSVKNFSCVMGNPAVHKHWVSVEGIKLNFKEKKSLNLNGKKYSFIENEDSIKID